MRGKVRLALLLVAAAATAAALPARSQSTPAAAPDPMAVAHAETVEDARKAVAALAEARAAGLGGVSEDYLEKMRAYASARSAVMTSAGREADLDAAVVKLAADYDVAYRAYTVRVASPDTTAVELGEAQDQRLAVGRALLAATQAATARQFSRLQAEGFVLPDPESRDLWAKGQTEFVPFMPQIMAIHGVEYTEFPDAPWQVELIDLGSQNVRLPDTDVHVCGGALIRADWVLTAAHCVWNRKTKALYDMTRMRVRGGSTELAGAMQTFGIDAVRLPGGARGYIPSSSTRPAQNDIALLLITPRARLSDGKALTTIPYARARQAMPSEPGLVTVTGWGATVTESLAQQDYRVVHNGRLRMSPSLRVAPLEPIAAADCHAKIQDRIQSARPNVVVKPLPASTLCAGSPLTGTCVGDSGGPLVAHSPRPSPDRPVLVGVVSWGVGCQDFTVFTRVSAFDDWIAATLAAHDRSAAAARRPAAH